MGVVIKIGNVEKDYFEKRTSETFAITIDFGDDLGNGSIESFAVNAEDSSGTSVTSTLINGVSENAGVLTIGVNGGSNNTIYNVLSSVTSNNTTPSGASYCYVAKIKMRVY